jgi:hypothetical protein
LGEIGGIMSEINFSDSDGLLDQIATALREEPIPDFSDPGLSVAQEASGRNPDRTFSPRPAGMEPRIWARWMAVGAAIAAIALLIVVLSAHGPGGGAGVAFAQVQQAVSSVKSMSCRTLSILGDQAPTVSAGVSVLGVGSRSEGPNGWVSITNLKARRSMWIDHKSHKAGIQQLYLDDGRKSADAGLFQQIRDLPASGAKALGATEFEGKMVLKFAFESLGQFVVFVDPKTHLPLRMELNIEKGSGGQRYREVTTDFVFDAQVDESLFEIRAPAGYAVSRCEEPKDRKPIDTHSWVASPEKGLGPVPMGASKDRIITLLGTPDLIEETYRGFERFQYPGGPALKGQKEVVQERLNYPSRGFDIDVSSREGMTRFCCYGRLLHFDSARDFLGKTDRQIGLGASIDDVVRVYGKPDIKTHLREDQLHYFHKGWSFLFREGKLASITAFQPRPDYIEFKDTGDGGWMEGVNPKKKLSKPGNK